MRKIRELLRLKFELGLSIHKTAASLSIARSTVAECLRRAAAAGIGWPLPQELDDDQLEARLYVTKDPLREAKARVAAIVHAGSFDALSARSTAARRLINNSS